MNTGRHILMTSDGRRWACVRCEQDEADLIKTCPSAPVPPTPLRLNPVNRARKHILPLRWLAAVFFGAFATAFVLSFAAQWVTR